MSREYEANYSCRICCRYKEWGQMWDFAASICFDCRNIAYKYQCYECHNYFHRENVSGYNIQDWICEGCYQEQEREELNEKLASLEKENKELRELVELYEEHIKNVNKLLGVSDIL